DANVIVVGSDIGGAKAFILLQKIRVPGEDRDAGLLCAFKRLADSGGVGRRNGDAINLFGDQVIDHLDLLFATSVLTGSDIQTLNRTVELLLRLFATIPRLIEERVIHVLGNQSECIFFALGLGAGCSRKQGYRGDTVS